MITVDGKKSHMVENVGSMLLPGSLAACVSHWQPVLPTICTGAWALNIFTAASPCTNPTPRSALVRWLVSVSCLKKSHHSLQLIKRFAFSLTVSVLLSLLVSLRFQCQSAGQCQQIQIVTSVGFSFQCHRWLPCFLAGIKASLSVLSNPPVHQWPKQYKSESLRWKPTSNESNVHL